MKRLLLEARFSSKCFTRTEIPFDEKWSKLREEKVLLPELYFLDESELGQVNARDQICVHISIQLFGLNN